MKDNELLYRLGQRLKELRKAKKWSLRDLEALTDIDNSELSKYEFGFISPQLLSLYKLSQAFGITLSKLLDIEKHGQLLFHCTIIDGTQVTHIKRGNIRKVSYSTIRLESTSLNSRSHSPRKRKKLFSVVI